MGRGFDNIAGGDNGIDGEHGGDNQRKIVGELMKITKGVQKSCFLDALIKAAPGFVF